MRLINLKSLFIQLKSWFASAKQRNLRQKLLRDRKMSGRASLEWEEEEDPPTEDEDREEIVIECDSKKRGVSSNDGITLHFPLQLW